MNSLKIGDFIRCKDKPDMVDTMLELGESGYESDFIYERDGMKAYGLEITDYTSEMYKKAFKYCLECFTTFADEIKYEYEDYKIDYEQAADVQGQIVALQNTSICTGKMKMLYEVVHLMNNSIREILEAEDDTSNTTDSANVS